MNREAHDRRAEIPQRHWTAGETAVLPAMLALDARGRQGWAHMVIDDLLMLEQGAERAGDTIMCTAARVAGLALTAALASACGWAPDALALKTLTELQGAMPWADLPVWFWPDGKLHAIPPPQSARQGEGPPLAD